MEISIRENERNWEPATYNPKLERCVLLEHELGGTSGLLKLPKGEKFEKHIHPGGEEVVVLEGSLRLGKEVYNKGDFIYAPVDSVHDGEAYEDTIIFFSVRKPSVWV